MDKIARILNPRFEEILSRHVISNTSKNRLDEDGLISYAHNTQPSNPPTDRLTRRSLESSSTLSTYEPRSVSTFERAARQKFLIDLIQNEAIEDVKYDAPEPSIEI